MRNEKKHHVVVTHLHDGDRFGFIVRMWRSEFNGEVSEHSANYEVFEVACITDDDPQLTRKGAMSLDPIPITDLDNAECIMSGFIKWEGCGHADYPATEHCMQHLCGRPSWVKWGALMPRLYDLVVSHIPEYDKSVGG